MKNARPMTKDETIDSLMKENQELREQVQKYKDTMYIINNPEEVLKKLREGK